MVNRKLSKVLTHHWYCLLPNITLAINPDPRHSPEISKEDKASRPDSTDEANQKSQEKDNFIVEKLNPDESHSLSYLLIESALGMNGKHLGSLWIRPDQSSSDDFRDEGLDNSTIGYPSRPLQLAKGKYTIQMFFLRTLFIYLCLRECLHVISSVFSHTLPQSCTSPQQYSKIQMVIQA